MKKYLILAAFAAVALGACTKVETTKVTESVPVSFGVYTGDAATKAVSETTYGVINSTDLLKASTYGFGVFAFHSDNSAGNNDYNNAAASNFTPNFMYNQQVTWNGTDTWEYSPIKYWPNEYSTTDALSDKVDKLTFFAYAPWRESNPTTAPDEGIISFSANNATGDPAVTFKVPAASENQIDLLYSNADLKNKTKYAVNSKVGFTFVHALSNLAIYPLAVFDGTSIPASNGTAVATGTTIKINSITITGKFNQEGTLNLAKGTWTSSAAATDQTVSYTPATAYDVTAIDDKADADAAGPVAEFMFVPSTAPANYVITIDYDVTTVDGALANDSVVNNVIHKTLSSLNFQVGQKMKLYVALGMTSVKVEASVGDWTNGTDQNVWLPVNL